ITGRLIQRLGEPLENLGYDGISHLFPTPAALAQANLDGIGMPGKRVQTLQRFAAAIASGELSLDLADGPEALVEHLCALPGIGPWTAEYIALRAMGEADAFPAADLGLLKSTVWGPQGIDARSLKARAEAWRPWRAYAAIHLWHHYAAGG
ncbi:DNA-3-methyladenine glycosylase 2 family protein, partial [Pseudomonas aeruginosa]|nr:DNA-3-methyladenine glycosylase 2 family protein [Pseudomonas aeruginosa]